MPVIKSSQYQPPPMLKNGHLQTLYAALLRPMQHPARRRERIQTPDDDFLDLDWSERNHSKLAILTHGLEGHSSRKYILGMSRALLAEGWDTLAWNCRGCSGEPNRKLRFYHSGATEDLQAVIEHALKTNRYTNIALLGFSLGGNMTLKYLGERNEIPSSITRAVTFSVPCDLAASSYQMASVANRIYMMSFLRSLRKKIRWKAHHLPGQIDDENYHEIKTFKQFDDRYTAPLHGFTSAEDYWNRCSSKRFISNIEIPTLLINARNDPFLTGDCYPVAQAESNSQFHLELPEFGGHVGFVCFKSKGRYWSETRALDFLSGHT